MFCCLLDAKIWQKGQRTSGTMWGGRLKSPFIVVHVGMECSEWGRSWQGSLPGSASCFWSETSYAGPFSSPLGWREPAESTLVAERESLCRGTFVLNEKKMGEWKERIQKERTRLKTQKNTSENRLNEKERKCLWVTRKHQIGGQEVCSGKNKGWFKKLNCKELDTSNVYFSKWLVL